MSIKTKIKMLTASRGVTLKKLAIMLSEVTSENYSYNSLLGKLNRESLSLKEAEIIAKILDYRVEFIDLHRWNLCLTFLKDFRRKQKRGLV